MRQRAKLLFDSATAGSLPGLRALASEERSLLFRHGDLTVDMVAFAPHGGLHVVYGQVLDARLEQPLPGAEVAWAEGEPSATDAFGQFSLGSIEPPGGRCLRVTARGDVFECAVPAMEPTGGSR